MERGRVGDGGDALSARAMFQLARPTAAQLTHFLAAQVDAPFSYAEVGATRAGAVPRGYAIDHNRVQLGSGEQVFQRAVAALHDWRMSSLGWTSIHRAASAVVPGQAVAIVVHHLGFWSLNACRVVYLLDEDTNGVRRAGFAYGTVRAHAEMGEERFSVEWHRADDAVWYDLFAFSRPRHPLARLGRPITRWLQRRFARESKQAMVQAIRETA
jgi:uncharacterized protein (UPF0548 family)